MKLHYETCGKYLEVLLAMGMFGEIFGRISRAHNETDSNGNLLATGRNTVLTNESPPLGSGTFEDSGSQAQYFNHGGNTYVLMNTKQINPTSSEFQRVHWVYQVSEDTNAAGQKIFTPLDSVRDDDPNTPGIQDGPDRIQTIISGGPASTNELANSVFTNSGTEEAHTWTTPTGKEWIITGNTYNVTIFEVNPDSSAEPLRLVASDINLYEQDASGNPVIDYFPSSVSSSRPSIVDGNFHFAENYDASGNLTGFDLVFSGQNITSSSGIYETGVAGVTFNYQENASGVSSVALDRNDDVTPHVFNDPTFENFNVVFEKTLVEIDGERFLVVRGTTSNPVVSGGTSIPVRDVRFKYDETTGEWEQVGTIQTITTVHDSGNRLDSVTITDDTGTERAYVIDGFTVRELLPTGEYGAVTATMFNQGSQSVSEVEIISAPNGDVYFGTYARVRSQNSFSQSQEFSRLYKLNDDGTVEIISQISGYEGDNGGPTGGPTVRASMSHQWEFGITAEGELFFFTSETLGGTVIDIVCFAQGTQIDTPNGKVSVEDLEAGMSVMTVDSGAQDIRWVGKRYFSAAELADQPHLKPIRITAGAFGNNLPQEDLLVSPQHRLLVSSPITQRMFGEREVLIAAKHLCGIPGIFVDEDADGVEYVHILLNTHEVVFANGLPSETLLPGRQALKALSDDALKEIKDVFPQLFDETRAEGEMYFSPARKLVTGRQGRRFTARTVKNSKHLQAPRVN